MPSDPSNDQQAWQALRQGEDRALGPLMDRWERPLFRFAYRYVQNAADAGELVAESFVRLYQNREKLRADTRPGAWLFTTLTRLCLNHNRWKRRHPSFSLDAQPPGEDRPGRGAQVAAEAADPAVSAERDEAAGAVARAIAQLPHDLKTAILLHHYERLSYQEISALTGCSSRGVETRLYRARARLRKLLSPLLDRA